MKQSSTRKIKTMANQVISFVADNNYLDHARSFIVNCKRQGEWTGDFCLISLEGCSTQDFEKRGIFVLQVPVANWDYLVKFHIFTAYFRRWKQALCSDLDVLVQGSLQKVFDELSEKPPNIYCTVEDLTLRYSIMQWDKREGEGPEAHPEVYKSLEVRFPHIDDKQFNASFIFYTPSSIPSGMKDELYALHEEWKLINPGNTDQFILNLRLYDRMRPISKNYACFFGFDYPENRIVAETRGWDGTETPVLLHYTQWHAPWIVKVICADGSEMGGYRNHRLGRLCHELYQENLAAFEGEFPIL